MKLIIDLSEEDYKESTDHLRGFNEKALKEPFMNATSRDRLEIALFHGIPLDDVKAEFINSYPTNEMGKPVADGSMFWFLLNKALKILDNIGEESEE